MDHTYAVFQKNHRRMAQKENRWAYFLQQANHYFDFYVA